MNPFTTNNARLLSDEQLVKTHEASLEILREVGMEVHNETAREVYARHGCDVDNETLRVKFPPAVVKEALDSIPPTFTFYARNPDYDRTVPRDGPLVMTASSAPRVLDPVTRKERSATTEDIARIARLVDRLEGIDLFSVSVLALDAPPGQNCLSRFYTALKHCSKPVRGSGEVGSGSVREECESVLRMAYTIAGGESAYRDHPFITHHYCPVISPLKMDEDSTELLMYYAEKELPAHHSIVPNAGLSSPLTLAGTLAQGNAEYLGAAALAQMVRQGTPMLYSYLPTVGDMRSGAYASGGIECGILNMAFAQMARFYNIPCSGYIGLTNSKLVDAQAGFEKGLSCMGGLLAGMDVLQFAGLIDALLTFDYGMAVIDNEISLMLKRVARGMEVSKENISLDEIIQVGPGSMFLETEQTFARMEDTALFPDVADRDTRQTWEERGGRDAWDKSLLVAKEIIGRQGLSYFSAEVDAEIRSQFENMVPGEVLIPEGW